MIARIYAQIVINLDDEPLKDAPDCRVKEALQIAALKVLNESMPTATCKVTAVFITERAPHED